MRGVEKRFGDTVALCGVDFAAARGEIHGLLGENGAGKTTLVNILSGLYRPDRGEILIDGRAGAIRSPQDALRHGIGMVHQHVELIPTFTALENILLGREGDRWWLRTRHHRSRVEALARRFGLALDLEAEVGRLAAGVQQKVEILKALHRGVDVLILDEPTTMLTPQEVDQLFATIRRLAGNGLTVIFITHKIREILANCDRVTVMRAGSMVATVEGRDAGEAGLVEMMIGHRLAASPREAARPADDGRAPEAPAALGVRGLTVADDRGTPLVRGVTFALAPGELVGLAGVAGNGQRELAETIVGLRKVRDGRIAVGGRDVTRAPVRARLAAGLAYIPEDRIHDGLLPGLSVAENLVLGLHPRAFGGGRLFDRRVARDLARAAIEEYAIAARDADARAIALSGGNIQKVLVARAMALLRQNGGRALIAMNPTRGLDVRATGAVRRRLVEVTRRGGAVLLVSEDLDELLALADRILVIARGAVVADLAGPAFDPYRIGALMTGAAA
jgi:simple sugar transport system ATP-binding protein